MAEFVELKYIAALISPRCGGTFVPLKAAQDANQAGVRIAVTDNGGVPKAQVTALTPGKLRRAVAGVRL